MHMILTIALLLGIAGMRDAIEERVLLGRYNAALTRQRLELERWFESRYGKLLPRPATPPPAPPTR
jgi:hypothetical protein